MRPGLRISGGHATVLTNAHVVKGATAVKVLLTTGDTLVGNVRGMDTVLDVAVVAISTPPAGIRLPSIPLSDCRALRVGQWAISIGNPLGLNNSVSLGVISSLKPGREATLDWVAHDYLQTDAAINTGNSGGPLLNERGEAIGIVTAKAGGINTEGLGFAVPIGRVLPILGALLSGEVMQHAMLGLQLTDAHTQAAELVCEEHDVALEGMAGALVIAVLPRSPAATAGIQAADLIVTISGRRIISSEQVQQAVSSMRLGSNGAMELGIVRHGAQRSVRAVPVDFEAYTCARKEEEKSQRRSPGRFILMQ